MTTTTTRAPKLVVGVSGASGSIYAKRLLEHLALIKTQALPDLEVGVVFSAAALEVWKQEMGGLPEVPFRRWDLRDFSAPFASGSAGWDAMVIAPCSAGNLARIAHGVSGDLMGRAADVMLKERRKLVLVLRETPLSLIHIENMAAVTRAGAVVLPASPSFYSRPASVDALVDTVLARVLDHVGVPNGLMKRWGAPQEGVV